MAAKKKPAGKASADGRCALIALALSAAFITGMAFFRTQYLKWSDLVLVGVLAAACGLCFGAMAVLLYNAFGKQPKKRVWAFLGGVAVFEAVLWTMLALINKNGQFNRRAITAAGVTVFLLFGLMCLAAFLRAAMKHKKAFNSVTAVLLCALFALTAALFPLGDVSELRQALLFTSNVRFDTITAQEVRVSDEEKAACRTWLEENILTAGYNGRIPAYDFSVDGERFTEHLGEWTFAPAEAQAYGRYYREGSTYIVTAKNAEKGLDLKVIATVYENSATCEWTVYLTNANDTNSGVISDFYGANCAVKTGNTQLYCGAGSRNRADDFTLLKARGTFYKNKFSAVSGRPSDAYLPYFNIHGKTQSFVLGIGWTGQWAAAFKTAGGNTYLEVRQEELKAYLTPGETIRSPLVSLSFYSGGNALKGFNTFRNWVRDSVCPANLPDTLTNMDVLYVSTERTAGEILADAAAYTEESLAGVDNFWMDAGWYAGCKESWYDGAGNWVTDSARFPDGITAVSDRARELGKGLVLWYEPERLVHGSELYKTGSKKTHWLVDLHPEDEGNAAIMWNLGEEDARKYLASYISKTLVENGVSVYRQDFNFEPLEYWEYADRTYYDGRTGIAENHYVSGLYAYLDALLAAKPGLVIDNCASGGRRLDLEMTRRSIPLWRSDYNCDAHDDILEATQAMSYGLSFWLPKSGTLAYTDSEYAARTSIYTGNVITSPNSEYALAYQTERSLLTKNYYPLSYAGAKKTGITAMQYGDGTEGEALIYKHAKCGKTEFKVGFSGLDPEQTYTVWDVDAPETKLTFTGRQLMDGGYVQKLPKGEKAAIVRYQAEG